MYFTLNYSRNCSIIKCILFRCVKLLMQKVKPYIATVSVGICFNLTLFFVKLYIGISTNSLTIYIDSINNLLDSIVCIAAIIGFWILGLKPSKKYPFGYGRTEDLISFITAAVVLIAGSSFLYSSLERILYPTPVIFSVKYTILIGVTAFAKLILALFYKCRNKKAYSPAIKNLQIDCVLDFFITLTAILSVTVTKLTSYSVDGFFGIVISIILCINGVKLCKTSCEKLISKKDDKLYSDAFDILSKFKNVNEISDLQCHQYGSNTMFCCELKTDLDSVSQAENLKQQIKEEFQNKFNSNITISIYGG